MVKSDNLFVSYTIFPANFVKQENGFRQVPGLSYPRLAQDAQKDHHFFPLTKHCDHFNSVQASSLARLLQSGVALTLYFLRGRTSR